ncbi:MAG: hypothetical protein ACNA8W_24530 [Bradymonadaceae bacterium]
MNYASYLAKMTLAALLLWGCSNDPTIDGADTGSDTAGKQDTRFEPEDSSSGGYDGESQDDSSRSPDVRPAEDVRDREDISEEPLQCDAPLANCSGDVSDGCSTNLSEDSEHCGRCNRSCRGGACVDERCEPVLIATGQAKPTKLTVDDEFIYVATQPTYAGHRNASVMRVPLTGGVFKHFTDEDMPYIDDIKYLDGEIYFRIMNDIEGIYLLDRESGSRSLATENPATGWWDLMDFILVSGDFFVADGSHGRIWRSLPAGSPLVLSSEENGPTFVRHHDGYLYWADRNVDNTGTPGPLRVRRAHLASEQLDTLATIPASQFEFSGMAIYGDHVYFSTSGMEFYGGAIQRQSLSPGPAPQPLVIEENYPRYVAVSDAGVFWHSYSDDIASTPHRLRHLTHGATEPINLARFSKRIWDLHVEEDALYVLEARLDDNEFSVYRIMP